MTQSDDFRSLAQRVRQTARAQLIAIRRARLAQRTDRGGTQALPERGGDAVGRAEHGGLARRRRRWAGGQAGSERLVPEDGALALPSRVPADCPVLIDIGPVEQWQNAVLPTVDMVVEGAALGPPAPPMVPEIVPDLGDQTPEGTLVDWGLSEALQTCDPAGALEFDDDPHPMAEVFGPFLTDEAIPEDAALAQKLDEELPVPGEATGFTEPSPGMASHAPDGLAASGPQAAFAAGASDLATLPGAGPDLIWMLQKCGITCLRDLAGADAATLVARLGLVGQIVNVAGWQVFARRQVRLRA